MTRSMTGYGQARWQGEGYTALVEVRSFNGRHFKLNARLPHEFGGAETALEKRIRGHIRRGSVDLYLSVERTGAQAALPINQDALAAYVRQLREVGERLGAPLPFQAEGLLALPGVLEDQATALEDRDRLLERIHGVLEEALGALDRMRQTEGANLRRELLAHAQALEEGIARLEAAQPQALQHYRERLVARVNRLLADTQITVGEEDLAREIAIYTERSSICEEIARLRSHLEQFREALDQDSPVGRRLEFLGQEMQREINTVGAKVADPALSRQVTALRGEVDKIREQALNVE